MMIAGWGCTQKSEEQPPSNLDGVSDGRQADRGNEPGDSQASSLTPSSPKGEVGRNEYTIQVGIFDRAEAADNLSYELRAQRINNFVQPVGNRWRVCVGRYQSRSRAESTLRILHNRGFVKAVIIVPEPPG